MESENEKSERPIFIVGVHRSGTTLLRYMLNSHPRIYLPPESDFIPRFFGREPLADLSELQINRYLEIIFKRYRFVREWQGQPPKPRTFYAALDERSPAGFLKALYQAYAAQDNAVRWGDKTPIYTSYLPLLHTIFPTAQFVHLIRDGRDVALSMLDKWGARDFHIDIYFTAHNWMRRTAQARVAGADLGDSQYYEMRYENLVRDPEPELRGLCAFLGESYLSEMAAPHRLARQQIEPGSFHDPVRSPPATDRIARWHTEMSPADLRVFQRVAGRLLQALGYPLAEPGEMPAEERARFYALKAKFLTLQAGRRTLQGLGLMPPI